MFRPNGGVFDEEAQFHFCETSCKSRNIRIGILAENASFFLRKICPDRPFLTIIPHWRQVNVIYRRPSNLLYEVKMTAGKFIFVSLFVIAPLFNAVAEPEVPTTTPTSEPTATSAVAPTATAAATKTPTPTATEIPKEDFSACFFDSDKKVDKVTRKGRKITVRFTKTKRTQIIQLEKSYTYFRCKEIQKKTAIVAKRRWKDKWTVIAYPSALGVNRVCHRIFPLGYRQLYKFSASGHLGTTDRAHSCSFIGGYGASVPGPSMLPLYDRNGNLISSFRMYAKFGTTYAFRYYTYAPTCSQIAGSAKAKTGSSEGYIGLGNGSCIKINNLYSREGAVY